MTSTIQSIHIDAPVGKVFTFYRDPANWQELGSGIVFEDVELTADGVGTTYTWVTNLAGVRLRGHGTFIEFVPDKRIEDKQSGSYEGSYAYSFESDGSGTRVTVEHVPGWLSRVPLLGGLFERHLSKNHAAALAALKAVMER